MKRELIVLTALLSLLFSNCTSDEKNSHNESESTNAHQTMKHEAPILLNDGNKWKVNEEMLPHIEKSELVFKNFKEEDYQMLSEEMMKHTNNLIQSCTMDGESHDELHKWLHPHIELIKELGKSSNKEEGSRIYNQLNKSFATFHKFFE